jgi:hypothetical protein
VWGQLKNHFNDLAGCLGSGTWLSRECQAGVSIVDRLLACQESDGQAFNSVCTIYWKLSTAGPWDN